MKHRYKYNIGTCAIACLTLIGWHACAASDGDDPQPTPADGRVAVELALSVSTTQDNASATTRMASSKVHQTAFGGIQDIRLIPLNSELQVHGDMLTGLERIEGKRHYFSENVTELNIGTTCFLCYANATDNAGGVTATFPTSVSHVDLDDISFSPVPIVTSSSDYSLAEAMAQYLTNIAQAEGWSGCSYNLGQYYSNFINNGHIIAGSSANIKALVAETRAKVEAANENPTVENAVKDAIDAVPEGLWPTNKGDEYPAVIGLPDGAAAMQWNGTKFVVLKQSVGSTPLSDHSRFVHPAPVYFYIDSPIQTATTSQKAAYTANETWSTILGGYSGTVVESTTRSVAIEEPLNYAVGCLAVTIQASDDKLKDNSETPQEITLSDETFPLKGVLLGGQYQQNYQFVPVVGTATDAEKILYDQDITGITLTKSESAKFYTLAFQSRDEMPVDIVLEFENNSGQDFKGENGGIVYKNTRFYLMGQLWPDPERGEDEWKRVFTKDYMTTIHLTIQSLKNAYNVIPDMKTATYALKVSDVAVSEWFGEGYKEDNLYNW